MGLSYHLLKFGQELVLVWLLGKSCMCLGNGHKRTQMSSCLAFQLCKHIAFVWVQVKSVKLWIHFGLQEFLNFLKGMWASLVPRNKLCIFSSCEHMLWSCMWCLFWVALLYVWFFRMLSCIWEGGLIFFFWTFFSNPSLINWDVKTFDALLPFHKVWSAN